MLNHLTNMAPTGKSHGDGDEVKEGFKVKTMMPMKIVASNKMEWVNEVTILES